MLTTLRRRLMLSHILPIFVIVPVMGIALIYMLETQVLLPDLARELIGNAALASELARENPGIWYDSDLAGTFVERVGNYLAARVLLLDTAGHLVASNDPADAEMLGQAPHVTYPAGVLAGELSVRTSYSRQLHAEIADVWTPVFGPDREVIGSLRLSYRLTGVQEQFLRLRYFILGVLIPGLLLGAIVGLLLALNIESSLHQVTQAIYRLVEGRQTMPLLEHGPAEIRLLLRAVNTLVERLNTMEDARRKLLANLVHELGRPLGALRSAVQALLGGADKDAVLSRELLAGMEDEMERLLRLLDDLAQLHSQVLGRLDLDRQPVKLSDWLLRVLPAWREAARQKGLHWQVNLPTDLPVVEADPDRLAQALGNLLSNAIKYTAGEGTISVGASVETNAVWIQVCDTGPGISAEEQAKIFTPFYRGVATTRFPQGMGLGLTIARDLIAAHGGRLEVESSPDAGSRFTLWLPLPQEQSQLP